MNEIKSDRDLKLQIIATAMHLSPEFGLTYKEIEGDGFIIDSKVEMLLSSDTPTGIVKSMSLALSGLADAYSSLQPDIVIVLGDRFETFCAASTACVNRIPIAHIHGGEITQGVIDEFFRHAITKASHLHFTSTEVYRSRVIQLGEHPERVFNVGALGVENIRKLPLLSRSSLEREIDFSLGKMCILVTFHPVTLEDSTANSQFGNLLKAIDSVEGLRVIFTKANADTEGRIINKMIDEYTEKNRQKSVVFTSMGQIRYLSAMKHVNALVGNSSSGIFESPSLKTPTVNIGDRQKGRVQAESIINCGSSKDEIASGVRKALSSEFLNNMRNITNPYEKKDTSLKIKEIIKNYDLSNILKKEFYDLPE
jgi:GDP/UDP-N,N'-diacetylbacillosamine 2-epimerase (hydrolysing)